MATAATTRLRLIAPEFATTVDADVDALVAIYETQITAAKWGAQAVQAVALLVAHELELQARAAAEMAGGAGSGSGIGPITSKRAGDVALTYGGVVGVSGSGDFDEAVYSQTRHGLAFLALRRSRGHVGFGVIT